MDKVTGGDNTNNIVARVTDDIPVAQREAPTTIAKSTLKQPYVIAGLASVGLIAASAGALASLQWQRSQVPAAQLASVVAPTATSSSPAPNATQAPTAAIDSLYGHLRYQEAPASSLVPIVADGSIKLRQAAAKSYQDMEAAARRDGVSLVPISGFRSLDDQNYLFFGKKAERGQVAAERAKVSAPPGYSEHHTGYAVDIGDGNAPNTNLSESFEDTAAFRWLKANAAYYSFEISFPRGNKQGVSYEPWHWRFMGDIDSLKTFTRARSLK